MGSMLYLRGTTYHLKRRVPKRFAKIDGRQFIYQSMHTDSLEEAKRRAGEYWQQMLDAWEAERAGETKLARDRFEVARDIAKRLGYGWLPAIEVANLPLNELLDRIEAVNNAAGDPVNIRAEAVLGARDEPPFVLSEALKAFWVMAEDQTFGKSEDQIRRWRNPRIKAFKNLISVIDDVDLLKLTRDNMLDFRAWWLDRVREGKVTAGSANKDFTHIAGVLKLVNDHRRLNLDLPVGNLNIREVDRVTRAPFSQKWIAETILAPQAFDNLNIEAKTIVLAMVNTGARPSELANLKPDHIRLDAEIPHIAILPDGRQLKTRRSRREIPLVGVSLQAFRDLPDRDLSRYADNATFSATVNKYMRNNGLMESENHTLYGLRHSFEDRLLVAGVDERVRRDLMGHALNREEYGIGGGLPERLKALQSIAL